MSELKDEPPKWQLSLRTLALSQPRKSRIQTKYKPESIGLESVVSKAALRAKSTPRLAVLAMRPKNKIYKKYDPVEAAKSEPIVQRSALSAKCSPRNEMLARNPVNKMVETLMRYQHLGEEFTKKMRKYIQLGKSSMYREMYWPKPPTPPEKPALIKSCLYDNTCKEKPKSKEEMLRDLKEWIEVNKLPRPERQPPPVSHGKRRPLSELRKRCDFLAQPRYIFDKFNEAEARRFTTGIRKAALLYKPSARVQQLAKPKPIRAPEGPPDSEPLSERAKARIAELAKPRVRAQGDNEEKENPYVVKPEALKAWCSPRTKELAKPRERE